MLPIKLLGWKPSSYEIYCQAYHTFGGSVCNHPLVLKILEDRDPNQIQFFHKKVNGKIVGALFTDKRGEIIHPYKKIPVIFENIILPVSPELGRCYLPAKSKELSIKHKKQFINFTYGVLNRRSICLVKDSFSKKTNKKRQSEMNKFLNNGGEVVPVSAFSSEQLSTIYLKLSGMRWGSQHHHSDIKELADFIESIRPMIFGNVLFYKGEACAYDLIYQAECNNWIYFDDHNGGINTDIKDFSVGSLLLFANINTAHSLCQQKNKEFIFSIGRSNDKWAYKGLWSNEIKLGKSIF
ncbi:hypothetical protein [Hafnia alvei]|uniref:Mig-14 protein n=2 Tax=Hafnia alvei TaxID=569 RepID=A0A1C6Z4I4_HAFAL|nr:hypothetical protein [Hafnia alvei]SCM53985.1 Mig-14 protein [Hafnia alvei]